ncbi:rhombotarget A [Alkanindiges hydrocarboniclasticus]|uniref:Rhombotarget A n=1 Tax=Alkanindiges hydrocarboniclasticus TaxID=1907941 RepID=A0A1S8CWC7_9GAMM|nr:rhombotarget A [Alkanindiges hydrocarboniclasticus]ONG41637.1 rhombotarget A [Alkanindiges hydrocarboniclasticus]
MLKRTIGLGLLCMASHAYSANIIVNTIDDEDGIENDKCSLREAIELINRTDANNKIPEAGYGGCNGKEASPIIVLETGKTYTLNKEVAIKKALSINVLDEAGNGTKYNGENNAIIQAKGTHRLFTIDDNNPNIANLTVIMAQVDLVGCGTEKATSACAPTGGLIFNRENLQLSFSRLKGGIASANGGAIYNEGIGTGSSAGAAAGLLTLTNVLFLNNKAAQGAAIYSIQPRYEITGSVFRDNEATAEEGAIVFVNRAGDATTTNGNSTTVRTGNIRNSTFFSNKGRVANLLDGMVINNSTIIKNTAGIYLNSATGSANLSNSIVAGNESNDCIVAQGNKAVTNNLLYNTGCGAGESDNPNKDLDTLSTPIQLIANAGLNGRLEGKCDQPPAVGLLCPFATEKEIFNGFFKPRLLTQYSSISDSPIVNRGRVISGGGTTNTLTCESTDQRGRGRETTVLCDIGSVELVIEDQGKIGQDIKYNQIAEIDLTDSLGDGQLWPKESCNQVFEDLDNPPVRNDWQPGCLQFLQGKEAKKGSLILDENALLKYTPFKNFHGSDDFSIKVVTTTSRFSEGVNDRSVTLRGTVVQEPENDFQNKSVKTSGGSTGIISLLGMLSLVWIRRRLQGVK